MRPHITSIPNQIEDTSIPPESSLVTFSRQSPVLSVFLKGNLILNATGKQEKIVYHLPLTPTQKESLASYTCGLMHISSVYLFLSKTSDPSASPSEGHFLPQFLCLGHTGFFHVFTLAMFLPTSGLSHALSWFASYLPVS